MTALVVPMPHMGVSVEEGTVVEWHKAVGDEVAAEEVLCEIATDKVDTEVVAPAGGVLVRIVAAVGESVPVGEPLAEIASEGEVLSSFGADSAPNLDSNPLDEHGGFDPAAAAEAVTRAAGGRKLASPLARRVAAEHGVDLGSVDGSGRNGRIRKVDVEAALAAGGPSSLPPGYQDVPHEVVPTSRVRQVIAEHMVRSRRTAAHMTTEVDVDLSAVVRARTQLNAERAAAGAPKLSYLPFIARATCAALLEHPDLNATFLGEQMVRWRAVNLGIAVDTEEGLLVPVVRDCDRLTAPAIGDAISDLAERARNRKLVPDDLAGGTFTISNPGSVGAVSAPAIINLPQVAILGVPTIQRRPWVITDQHGAESIAIRPILRLAVTFDHRALDGADATRFAVAVKDRLEAWGVEAYG